MMQIKEITLYSRDGKKRAIPFQPGKVNIITGKSATGKSAIIQIIDYCLGSSRCDVPEGVIREKVSWFGLLLKLKDSELFIARECPSGNSFSSSKCFFQEGRSVSSPNQLPTQTTSIEAVVDFLTAKIGIGDNLHTPPEGQTRKPLAATLRSALLYCYQDQDIIASKTTLFHRQNEPFIPQAIKDTLPYFLGVLREDHLALLQELQKAKRHLSGLQLEFKEVQSIKGTSIGKAFGLLGEAKEVGIIDDSSDPQTLEDVQNVLLQVKKWNPDSMLTKEARASDYFVVQSEMFEIENQITDLDERIQTARHFATAANGFEGEAKEQLLRLESIGLFGMMTAVESTCLFCSSRTPHTANQYEVIKTSITRLHQEIDTVVKEQPKISEFVTKLATQRESLAIKHRKKSRELEAVVQQQEQARVMRDRSLRVGQVLGKISLWLESVDLSRDDTHLKTQIEKWSSEVRRLEKLTDPSEVEELLSSALNKLAQKMTKDSETLKLEHTGHPVRLDLKELTVVVDLEKPVPLRRIGSGENHVGYHLLAHAALHTQFIKLNRPVPRFLVLDQPSQVYYPPEKRTDSGTLEKVTDEDRLALTRMFKYIFDFVRDASPNFQIILLDHASPDDAEFKSYIVEEWRGDKALIPSDWIA